MQLLQSFTPSEFTRLATDGGESEIVSEAGGSTSIDNRLLLALLIGIPVLLVIGGAWLLVTGFLPKKADVAAVARSD